MFRKVIDGEDTLIVCDCVDDPAVTAKDKETFDDFHAQLKEELPVSDMGDLSWYLRCAFERDKIEGVMPPQQMLRSQRCRPRLRVPTTQN